MTHPTAPAESTAPTDIRLIATDMDGTLLDESGQVPDSFWPLLDDILEAGIVFAPSSGRQYQTLRGIFGLREGLVYIAENGTNVVRDDVSIALEPVDASIITPIVEWVRGIRDTGANIGVVICGAKSAYIERTDKDFVTQVKYYYAALTVVDDVIVVAADDDILKIAVFDFGHAETRTGPALLALDLPADVVISGQHWVDAMRAGVNKGTALTRLQGHLGISRDQTMAFGDYLNDAEMLDAAGQSYAVANAHPSIRSRARHIAPSNADEGVITTIRAELSKGALDATRV